MADTITVKFKVMEDGSLKAIGKDADKASAALDKTGKSARTTDRNLKGTAQMTSNTTKSFSKMSQGITGGLVPAYATLAANVFALSAAFNFFKRAADVKILEEGQVSYAKNTGLALQTVTRGLREASGGMLGFREAAEAAAIGVAKGFSPKQLNDLAEGARKASAALGRNFEDSFDRLIRGASKAEPELLDELGITLRLETATKKYGEAIGKNAKDLTAFERSQAVLIETQRQLNEMYSDMEGAVNPFVQLGKTFDDLIKAGTNFIMPLFEGIANIINRSAIAAVAVFGALGVSILKAMVPMDGIKEGLADFQRKSDEAMAHAINDQMEYQKQLQKTREALKAAKVQTVKSAARGLGVTESKLVQKAQAGQLTDPKQIGQLKATLKRAEVEYKKHGEITKGIFKGKDIEAIRSLKTALNHMDKDHIGFVQRQKMRFKGLTLAAKKHYMRVKQAGVSAFSAIGKAASFAGKAMNKAMKVAGIVGMFMMIIEIGRELMQAPMDIVLSIIKGIDFLISAVVRGFGHLIGFIAAPLDGLQTKFKEGINGIIKGYNFARSLIGKDPIELISTETSGVSDLAAGMKDFTSDLAGAFETSAAGQWLQGFQERREAAQKEAEAYGNLTDAIKGVGTEVDNIVTGLATKKGAIKETAQATALSSLAIADLMRKAQAIKDPAKQAKAVADLKKQLQGIAGISPEALIALNNMDITTMEGLERSAQAAVGGLAGLKDGIQNINQAISGGDLLSAEIALKALKTTADTTGAAFEKLFGPDSEAAAKALADFEASFSGADMTANQFLDRLIQLRKAQEALAVSTAKASLVGGTFAETFKLQNAEASASLAVEQKRLELAKATAGSPEEAKLQAELKRLEIAQQIAQINAQTGAMGGQMGAALATDVLADQGLQAQMSPMLGELAKLGPEGELIQGVVNGAFAIQDAFSNAFEVMNTQGVTTGDKVAAGLQTAATAVSAISGIMQQASKQAIAEIDQQIAAEQKRDGKSAASVAKIEALEKKKEQAKRKAFERDKKMKMAEVIIATATAIQKAVAASPLTGGLPFSAVAAGIGAAQLAIIAGTSYQGGGGGAPSTPSQISVGSRSASVDLARGENAAGELAYARGAQGIGTGMTNFRPAFSGYKNRAAGGFVVGEQGPELFMPEIPGEIVPAGRTPAGQTNVNFSISAVDATGVEELLLNQRGNIIGMIREAANEHGEFFLEGVQETSY